MNKEHIEIRPARVTDAESIYQLIDQELGYQPDSSSFNKQFAKRLGESTDRIVVVALAGQVVGFVHACEYPSLLMSTLKDVLALAVDHRLQHQGLGRSLLQEVENWAQETGAEGIRLLSGSTRHGAHQFYEACGYERLGEKVNFRKMF